jgi:molybdopterin converting factor small subunit
MKILLFAQLRIAAGFSSLELPVTGTTTGKRIWEDLARRYPALGKVAGPIGLAVDQEITGWDQELKDHQEVAFLPPVSGG